MRGVLRFIPGRRLRRHQDQQLRVDREAAVHLRIFHRTGALLGLWPATFDIGHIETVQDNLSRVIFRRWASPSGTEGLRNSPSANPKIGLAG